MNGKEKRREEDLADMDWGNKGEGKNKLTQAVSTDQNLPLENRRKFQGKCEVCQSFPAEEMADYQTILRDNNLDTFNFE